MIRDVWASNLEQEIREISELLPEYSFVSMDTEFPGVVAKPVGNMRANDYQYQTLRCNVDILKIIQLGITLTDKEGNRPPNVSTWQFNFQFSLKDDMYNKDSIDLLTSCGLDFDRHENEGIDVMKFGEIVTCSGLVINPSISWVSFHSGYDFGYFLKVLSNMKLPEKESEFFELLDIFFPCIYDIKYILKLTPNLKGGLQDVADDLGVKRIGAQHQAGSDSLLTAETFFKLVKVHFDDQIDNSKFKGILFGLGQTAFTSNGQSVSSLSYDDSIKA